MRLIFTLCIGVSKKTHLDFYTYDITKWCKVYTKTGSWFQKSHEVFGQLQTSSGKSKKLKFDGLLLSKKYIPSAKTLYTEDLSNITFNYLCENLLTIFHGTTPLYFLAQTLYTFYKSSPHQSANFENFHCWC